MQKACKSHGFPPLPGRLLVFLGRQVFRGSLGSLPSAKEGSGRKKVMLITRGTRGDVQPFVALARGLPTSSRIE